jgi:hypothetical protein
MIEFMNTQTTTTKQGHTTKPGKHGTLFLYRIEYKDPIDSGFPVTVSYMYAYNEEHVYDRWAESEEGFEILSVKRTVKK